MNTLTSEIIATDTLIAPRKLPEEGLELYLEKIEKEVKEAIEKVASDIHLLNGLKPILRIRRTLTEMKEVDPLDEAALYDIYDYKFSLFAFV